MSSIFNVLDIMPQAIIISQMIFLFIFGNLVYQQGDTLIFEEQGNLVEKWVINESDDHVKGQVVRKAKISYNHQMFLIYEEKHSEEGNLLSTKITFYNADKEELWEESRDSTRMLSYYLSNICNKLFIITDTDERSKDPSVSVVQDGRKFQIVEQGSWRLIFDYKISSNCKYIVMHCRKPYVSRLWDYIYSVNLETRADWEYLFPVCTTCKRGKITLDINDSGEVEVIYRKKHRILSNEGKLVKSFIKVE